MTRRLPTPAAYVASDGTVRPWHPERPPDARCYDCALPYGTQAFGDLSLPNEVWARISPSKHEPAGLLCPRCIFERLAVLHHPGLDFGTVAIWPASIYEAAP